MAVLLVFRQLDGGKPNTDSLSIAYVVIAIVYTLLLACELCLLYTFRSAFCVKIRNIKMIFATVSILHVYLVRVLLLYSMNGLYPCAAEFWVMSLFLPSGMALFQACNAKVLTVHEHQHRLAYNFLDSAHRKRPSRASKSPWEAWRATDAAKKVYIGTLIILMISFVPTIVLFFGSRRFHAHYGFFGIPASDKECRRGGEWVPSILVQLFWTVIVGPWILWKIRDIKDVHSWAWQTRLAVLAGFPGTPLWIAFTYASSHGVSSIDRYFAPAAWFIPSLVVSQQVLIVIPLYGTFKSQSCRKSLLRLQTESIASSHPAGQEKSATIFFSKEVKLKTSVREFDSCFERNMDALVDWATSRDFSGENVIFLREVLRFKKKWISETDMTKSERQALFGEASHIFFALIYPSTAAFPINIEYNIIETLQNTFLGGKLGLYPHQDAKLDDSISYSLRENLICPWNNSLDRPTYTTSSHTSLSTLSTSSIVPSSFTEDIFDEAFENIKYLVFTNTWPRYVDATFPKELV